MVEDFVGHLRRNITALCGKQLLCRTGDFSHIFRIFFFKKKVEQAQEVDCINAVCTLLQGWRFCVFRNIFAYLGYK